MKYLKHYYKILNKIISSEYPYGKINLLCDYTKLIIKSIAFFKLGLHKKIKADIKNHKIVGLSIISFSYSQLINLLEEIFIYQVYKFESTSSSPFIIDCGSNIGLSVLYFKKLYPTSTIIAFEPDRETFALLEQNILNNKVTNVTLFNFALSDFKGKATLYKRELAPGSLNMSIIETRDKPFTEAINTEKVSNFIQTKVNMIKMDVEGAELLILNDLIQSNKMDLIENMIIEFHPNITKTSSEEFSERINSNNFSCYSVIDKLHNGATEIMIHCKRNNLR